MIRHALVALVLASCSPLTPPVAPAPPTADRMAAPAPRSPAPQTPAPDAVIPEPASPPAAPRFLRLTLSGIDIRAVVFDARTHRLVVADQPGGPGSRWPDSRAAGRALGGLAAINGGFFTPEGEPLGLVTSSGASTGALNRASSLGSGFYVERRKDPALLRRERFEGGREVLQTGPFLVENRRPVAGLGPETSPARSFIATDGRHGWILARTGPCSLADLAQALAGSEIGGIAVLTALNLDGGRSSEFWASGDLDGGPVLFRPLWNRPVRNFLVLKRRQ